MSKTRVSSLISREGRAIARVLPFVVLAVVCAILLGPVLSSTAAPRFQSPQSPILPSASLSPIKVYPTEVVPWTPPQAEVLATPTKAVPEKVPPPKPTATLTRIVEVTAEISAAIPPTQPPVEPEAESAPPPTLWVIAGLVLVGGVIAALVVFRKK